MRTPRPLPRQLGSSFTVQDARDAGLNGGRLRRPDLEAPFHGIRTRSAPVDHSARDVFERQAAERRIQAFRYAPRLKPGQFLSHETAVSVLGGPLPLVTADRAAVDGMTLPVHVSTLGAGPLVRATGVQAHRADPRTTRMIEVEGFLVADHATAWGQLGSWGVPDLVALGDHLCRVWRPGPGRPDAGRPPLTTVADLASRVYGVRRHGIRRLREAIELIREDSWSPRESKLRCLIVRAGLPEPTLNQDVYDEHGRFLGCFDLVYLAKKIAIEYHGLVHATTYAADVERIAALRAAGWTVIEVTSALFARRDELLTRIRRALGL
ncbi:hypothetical protein [Microbacterium abyssi]|uniref:hypothetical protein n=1 Tax=Microbacterium abyssi TaxID=2782166 RepID=UPI0018886C3A|nr:hypothetical protein [Microbacterium sp. A18JL241]